MDSLIRFYNQAAKLKRLKRAGWGRCGIEPQCESVADHTFGVATLALLLPDSAGVDRERCVALALVHDLAESLVGDITPHDGIDPAEKRRREQSAIAQLTKLLDDGNRLTSLWQEFEAGQSPEAMLVRDLDVIEMAWQARSYHQSGELSPESAATFIDSAKARIRTPAGKQLLQVVLGSG